MNDPRTRTEREAAVAERAARGQTNVEIVRAVLVSPKTVEWNLSKIYRKLGVRSRTVLGRTRPSQAEHGWNI